MVNDALPSTGVPSSGSRAGGWITRQIEPDGSLRGAVSINDYYKAVAGLAAAGRQLESERLLDFIVGRFLRPGGDLDGTGCVWFDRFRIYPHAWLLIGAVLRARFDLVATWSRFLLEFQEPESGGFFRSLEDRQHRGQQEAMTTGLAAIALLWAGQTGAALRAGHWFRRLWEAQPDVSRHLYFTWNCQGGLVTSFPAEQATEYAVDCGKPSQWYFQYGIAAALSAGLFGATGDRSWLALGRSYLDATRSCQEDVYRRGASGKIGWGAAWMYRVTRDAADRKIAATVWDNLRAAQHPEGWWQLDSIYSREPARAGTGQIDLTAEFAALQSWMGDALAAPA